MAELDPIELNVSGVRDLVTSKTNKVLEGASADVEGLAGDYEDELSLDLSDEELLDLKKHWEAKYAGYEGKIRSKQLKNLAYYLGKQAEGTPLVSDTPIASNLLFQAEETFLPAALSKNPDPVVYSDNSDEGNKLADDVKVMLQFHADQLVLRRKLAMMVRQWSIYHLGVLKYGWNEKINDVSVEVRKIQDFIFDPDGFVDAYGDFESYVGERITISASRLVDLFPKHKEYITILADGKMGTDLTYTEWWTDEYCFFTLKDKVLDKHKNEFFNYAKKETDQFGMPTMAPAKNHFAAAKKPYTFLSVFSLGEQPHDVTGLIEQNIPQQNRITRRTQQIDDNISRANNSDIFSEDNFNQETAKQAAGARKKGNPILIPSGRPIAEAMTTLETNPVSDSAFKSLEVDKQDLLSIFGTEGITSQPANEDTTARGMILNQQYDNSRIGGGIGDAIEQVAENTFNWLTQLYYVYYDEPHFAAVMGQLKATEYVTLSSQNFDRQLIVSVSPDSMKPKDEITIANQATELFQMKAIGPKTLLTMLNFPNPDESAADGVLYAIDPQAYLQMNFPELAQQLQQMQQQQMQMQQMAQQQQLQQEGQQGQQQLQQKAQGAQQDLQNKGAAHEQKMKQNDEVHGQKMGQNEEMASAALRNVKLPK